MVFFKGRRIKNLLENYKSPDVILKDYEILKEFDEFGVQNIEFIIEFFQQKKLPASKAQFLLEKFADDSSKDLILPLIGDPFDEVRRVAKEIIKKRWAATSSQTLIDYLGSQDIYKRNNAIELLSQFQDKSCEQQLISLFNTSASELKRSILKILSSFGTTSSNRLIISALNDEDWQVRLMAVKLITKLKLSESIDSLIEKLLESEPQIKKFAIEAIGILGNSKATKPLLELLKDDDLMVRQKAVDALIEIADADVISDIIVLLKESDVNVRRCAVEVLRNMKDPKTSAALMQAIKDSDWWVRQIATDSLTSLKGGNIVSGFIGLTKDPDENIRRCAVEFFIQVPSPDAYEALIDLLEDEDWWVRERAIDALGKLKDPRVIPFLMKMIDDQAVCKAIPGAFAEIGGDEGFKYLRDLLFQGQQRRIRLEAMKAMVTAKGAESINDLKKCLADTDKEVSNAAITFLKELTGKVFAAEDADTSPPGLIQNTIAPGSTVTEAIVVIDLCNSTDITSRYGDNFAMKLMQRLTAVVNPIAKREKCQFIKGTGDGFLMTFPSALHSIQFSLDVLANIQNINAKSEENQRINLRFAINFGEAKVDDKGDRLGAAVSMTFRIEGLKPEAAIQAEGCMPCDEIPLDNRIFITENLEKETTKISGITTRFVGLFELKGITGLHRVYHLTSDKK